jgi:hypothetical protein
MVGFVEPAGATIGPIPAPVEAALRGKSVALVGLADEEAERLCEALERASARPRLFEASSKPSADAISGCSVVMVHVRPPTLGTYWLHPASVTELKQPWF